MGGGQILERRNVERYFEILKLRAFKKTKDELFVIFEFNCSYFRIPLNTKNIQ